MNSNMDDRMEELERMRLETRTAASEFRALHETDMQRYRAEISEGLEFALSRLRSNVSEISAGDQVCDQLVTNVSDYVAWMRWTLSDLAYCAVAMQLPPERLRAAVASCGLVYLSFRIFEDVVNRRFWCQGKPSLLESVSVETRSSNQGAEGLTVLAGLLLCFQGLSDVALPTSEHQTPILEPLMCSIRGAIIGLVMKHTLPRDSNQTSYARPAQLQEVDCWSILYTAIDPSRTSPLYPFLARYRTCMKYLEDAQNYTEDQARGRPNLVSAFLSDRTADGGYRAHNENQTAVLPREVGQLLADMFVELGQISGKLPRTEYLIAQSRLGEALEEAYRAELFKPRPTETEQRTLLESTARLELHWYSDIQQVIEQGGDGAIVQVGCAVCGSTERNFLFRKQGFAYHRCRECSHIYPSPQLNPSLQARMGQELEDLDAESTYLEVQKIYAAAIAQLLHSRAPGNRLLDIGFGRGYLMELAQAYGFQVYGVDGSKALVDRLRPHFGNRLHAVVVGKEEIPWNSFDVVVMSHIVEHLPRPIVSLTEIRNVMNPGAILYVSVPDMQSLPFKIFGKKWDVINPLVHYQYFNQVSLSRLLKAAGFVNLERIRQPPLVTELSTRWVRLMRRLSQSDSSELTLLAQVPGSD